MFQVGNVISYTGKVRQRQQYVPKQISGKIVEWCGRKWVQYDNGDGGKAPLLRDRIVRSEPVYVNGVRHDMV